MLKNTKVILLCSAIMYLMWMPHQVHAASSIRAETSFCSDGGGNNIFVKNVKKNKPKYVCFQVKSKEKEEIRVTLRLLDGLVNRQGYAVCRSKGTNKNTGFSKLSRFFTRDAKRKKIPGVKVSSDRKELSFNIKPNKTQTVRIGLKVDKFEHIKSMKAPKKGVNFDGVVGCIATLGEIAKPVPGKLAIQVRRGNTLIAIPGSSVSTAAEPKSTAKKKKCKKGDTANKSGTVCFPSSKMYQANACQDGYSLEKKRKQYCVKDGYTFTQVMTQLRGSKKKNALKKPICKKGDQEAINWLVPRNKRRYLHCMPQNYSPS
jgi:hypothetical protein